MQPRLPPTPPLPGWLADRVIHRDAQILVIDKPAGLAVHPGPKTHESLEAYLPALAFGLKTVPQPAHRLDRDTSGCLVLGRMPKAVARLGRLFQTGAVEKLYWAIVEGAPAVPEGRIDLALRKHNDRSGWRMVADAGGLAATTDYRLLATGGGISLMAFRPHHGRTHQIRIHAQALGCPVWADPVYGNAVAGQPHALHARALRLPLGEAKGMLTVEAPLPPHLVEILDQYGLAAPAEAAFF